MKDIRKQNLPKSASAIYLENTWVDISYFSERSYESKIKVLQLLKTEALHKIEVGLGSFDLKIPLGNG